MARRSVQAGAGQVQEEGTEQIPTCPFSLACRVQLHKDDIIKMLCFSLPGNTVHPDNLLSSTAVSHKLRVHSLLDISDMSKIQPWKVLIH